MNWNLLAAYGFGLITLPTIGCIAWIAAAMFLPSRRWTGCHTCAYWTTSLVPVVRWFQWRRHAAWAFFAPAHHESYGRAHPPRHEPEDRDVVPTNLLLAALNEGDA